MLIDAVSAAQFIPQKRSDQLVARLAEMGGPSNREKLKPQIMVSEHVKAKNADMMGASAPAFFVFGNMV